MKRIILLAIALAALGADSASAQPLEILRGRRVFIGPPGMAPAPSTAKSADDAADADQEKLEQTFPGGASLKTDAEQARLLKRAEQCVEDGRLDLAAVLWQKVLDEAGDTLMVSRDQPPSPNPTTSTGPMPCCSINQ